MKRNSPNDIGSLDDLSHLAEVVVDKRVGKRAVAKKNRRNRHYENQFIRNTLSRLPAEMSSHEGDDLLPLDDPENQAIS